MPEAGEDVKGLQGWLHEVREVEQCSGEEPFRQREGGENMAIA
jgi:hypothetical protein